MIMNIDWFGGNLNLNMNNKTLTTTFHILVC